MARATKSKGRPGSCRGADGKFIHEHHYGDLNEPHVGATAMQVIAALLTGAIVGWIAGAFVS
jgi:hypothetical protein